MVDTPKFNDRDVATGLLAVIMTMSTLLEQRGVLDREEFAKLLEDVHNNPAMPLPDGLKAFLDFFVLGLRTKNFENLPPAIQMIRY